VEIELRGQLEDPQSLWRSPRLADRSLVGTPRFEAAPFAKTAQARKERGGRHTAAMAMATP
jgi:hypothetical protein